VTPVRKATGLDAETAGLPREREPATQPADPVSMETRHEESPFVLLVRPGLFAACADGPAGRAARRDA
jgi:hypothetical protein